MADITTPLSSSRPTTSKSVKAPKKRRGGFLNLLLIIGIIVTISLFAWAEQQRRDAQQKLQQAATELDELRKSAETSGQEVANKVLEKLRTHIDIPTDPAPTVATIVDADALRGANEFYTPAENGDHLIITTKRAILYDPDRDIILDVVPVAINQSEQATPNQTTPTASPSPTVSAGLPTTPPTGTSIPPGTVSPSPTSTALPAASPTQTPPR